MRITSEDPGNYKNILLINWNAAEYRLFKFIQFRKLKIQRKIVYLNSENDYVALFTLILLLSILFRFGVHMILFWNRNSSWSIPQNKGRP